MDGLTFDLRESAPHILAVRGEVDLATEASFLQCLLSVPHGDLVVDCGGIEFIGAAGLRVLIVARARRRAQRSVMSLTSVPALMRRILGLCGLDDLLRVTHAAVPVA